MSRSAQSSGPAGIGESLADAGGVLAAISDPITSAKRRHKIITDTIRFVRQRLDDPQLREMPIVRWGQAIADGRIGHDVLSRLLVRLDGMRERGELRVAPWVYFVSASKRAFRERGLDWPEPFAKR